MNTDLPAATAKANKTAEYCLSATVRGLQLSELIWRRLRTIRTAKLSQEDDAALGMAAGAATWWWCGCACSPGRRSGQLHADAVFARRGRSFRAIAYYAQRRTHNDVTGIVVLLKKSEKLSAQPTRRGFYRGRARHRGHTHRLGCLPFDLYRLASTQTTTLHAAVTLADTVSRDEPHGLTEAELRQKMDAFVQTPGQISAPGAVPHLECRFCGLRSVQETPADPAASPTVLWTEGRSSLDSARRSGAYADLVQAGEGDQSVSISHEQSGHALPDCIPYHVGLRELAIVAAVCVERTNTAMAGAVYAHYIVPARADNLATNLGATS